MAARANRENSIGLFRHEVYVMKYSEFIRLQMVELSKRPETVFIGYNLKNGSRGYGTMIGVPPEKIIEMPVAEALMTGMATGMALEGFLPILFFERHDFLLVATDQIINHLAKIDELSHGEFKPKVIIRAVVGADKPFDPGPQHKGEYNDLFESFLGTYSLIPQDTCEIYFECLKDSESVIIVEFKEEYNTELPDD
jgi:acetoin:2,6-dichlorophenolindophenol oxidoreductase subunit beta